jgi:hypothetical protein
MNVPCYCGRSESRCTPKQEKANSEVSWGEAYNFPGYDAP